MGMLSALALLTCVVPVRAQTQLLVSDDTNNQILRFDASTGAPWPAPGNSGAVFVPADSGGLVHPRQMLLESDGNLLVTEFTSGNVLEYNGTTGAFLKVFASGGSTDTQGAAFGPDGNLYIASGGDDSVIRYNGTTGAPLPSAGNSGATFTTGGGIDYAGTLAFGPDNLLYVNSYFGGQILRYNATTGVYDDTFASGLNAPSGMVFHDGSLYVAEENTSDVLKFDPMTGTSSVFVTSDSGELNRADGLVFAPDGDLLVASYNSGEILRYDGTTGAYLNVLVSGNGLGNPVLMTLVSPASSPSVPEPGSLALLWAGMLCVLPLLRRRH
jgi:sugar lactone lactonase YvrE